MNNTPKLNSSILLYDGHCTFCTAQAQRLSRFAGPRLVIESFQGPGVLARYPGLTYEECMKEIKLVSPEKKVSGGAEAVFRALSLNKIFLPFLWIYLVPGIKQISDWVYRIVARNRYKIQGKNCPDGTCSLHGE